MCPVYKTSCVYPIIFIFLEESQSDERHIHSQMSAKSNEPNKKSIQIQYNNHNHHSNERKEN